MSNKTDNKINNKVNDKDIKQLNELLEVDSNTEVDNTVDDKLDNLLLEAIASKQITVQDRVFKLNDRTIVDSFISKVVKTLVISISGKKVTHQFSNGYGIIGQISVRDMLIRETSIVGVLLPDSCNFYTDSQDYFYSQDISIEKLKTEVMNAWGIDNKLTKDTAKQLRLEQQKLEAIALKKQLREVAVKTSRKSLF